MSASTTTEQLTARSRYVANIYFQDGTVVTAFLVLLLYLLLAVSLDAAGYVDNLTVLVPVTFGSFMLAFLMSVSRFDGFFALSHSMFAGLAWILFLMSRSVSRVEIAPLLGNDIPEMQAQAYFVLLQWLNWVDAAMNQLASANNYVFIFEMCFLMWWLTYLGVWSIFRYGYTWRAIAPASIVLLINAYYAPESVLGFLVIFFLIGLLLLVRTNLSEHQLRWRYQRVMFSQDIALDFLRNGFLYSVVVLALALILPGLGRNPQVRGVLAPVNQQWEITQERVNQLYQGLNRQAGSSVATFGDSLTLSGARNTSDRPLFRVRAPEGRYWRAIVYDSFDGRTWQRTVDDQVTFAADETIPVADWAMREAMTQTIILDAPIGYVLFSAPDLRQIDVPLNADVRTVSVNDGQSPENIVEAVEVIVAQSRRSLGVGDSYTAVSRFTNVTEVALRSASQEYPPAIVDTYLQLPENFSERVAQDAIDVTADAVTVYDKARALEIYLRGYEYNDEIEAPPPDRDPIEYFLYDIREGYCDYYATSMVLMLRSLGIPSRAVSGYAEGFFDREANEYRVTQRDAHTWVEVYFPGYGWIEFEPTAGETQLNRPEGTQEDDASFDNDVASASSAGLDGGAAAGDEFEQFANPNAFGEDFNLGGTTQSAISRFWWVWSIVLPLLLAIGFFFLRKMHIIGPTQFDHELAPILYERLHRWAARLGLAHEDSRTPYEVARGLGLAVPTGRESIYAITEDYVQLRFGAKQVEGSAERMQSEWRRLQPELWRTWLNKVLRRNRKDVPDAYRLVD